MSGAARPIHAVHGSRDAPAQRTETLCDLDALRAHRAQWLELWWNAPDATPF